MMRRQASILLACTLLLTAAPAAAQTSASMSPRVRASLAGLRFEQQTGGGGITGGGRPFNGTLGATTPLNWTDAGISRTAAATLAVGNGTQGDTSGAMSGASFTATASMVSALFRSTVAKVLFRGIGTGPTQLASTQTTAPTCTTNCGTPGNVCVGSDSDMVCTMGTTPASGFVVVFNGTWAAAPSCNVQMALAGMVVGKLALTAATTTGQITIVTNGTAPVAGDLYSIQCRGTQ